MNYNLSPKKRVLKDATFARLHRKLVEDPSFEFGLQVALAEYAEQLAVATGQDPAAKHWKLAGAHEVLSILRNLSETTESPVHEDLVNLGLNRT